MLFVTIIQFVAVGFTITALVKNTLMLSPEQHGVTCNITSPYVPKKNISAEHLVVYWGWQTLEVRWDFWGLTDTQVWLKETYEKTYDYRCKGDVNITLLPTPAPILHPKTPRPTKSPTVPPTNITTITNNANVRTLLNNENEDNLLIQYEIPLPLRDTIYYPFKITHIYDDEYEYAYKYYEYEYTDLNSNYNNNNNQTNHKQGCDDLEIVIETGKSYFSLLVCGLFFECIGLILLIPPTCHLVSVKTRRLLKQIVIGLNTVSFMLLLMAFAIWFAYFSTNINQVIEQQGSKNFSVCILGEPIFGESIAYLLSGWLLIGFATMSACYLSNRPKRWYRWLRHKRNYNFNNCISLNSHPHSQHYDKRYEQPHYANTITNNDNDNDNNNNNNNKQNGTILEEEDSQSQTEEETDSSSNNSEEEEEQQRLGTLINRTPSNNSSGSNDTYMTADGSASLHSFRHANNIVMKGDMYPIQYSPN